MADRAGSILTPLVIAAMGLVPLALMASGATPEGAAVTAPDPIVIEAPATTTSAVPVDPVELVITTPAPTISGVSDEVARVLAAQGFSSEEAVAGLPDSVTALLRDRGVVLTIAVERGE